MAYFFADSFDCYATAADAAAGYWDTGNSLGSAATLGSPGRFTGTRCLAFTATAQNAFLTKASNANDAVHHFVVAYYHNSALSGTVNTGLYLQLLDGTTNQCCIVFRQDGAILLQSGALGGTTLATYASAVTASNTWTVFEFEVVINNTTGSFTARKNGNTSNDFSLGSLNTRGGTANNYANKLTMGIAASQAYAFSADDLIWRSDPTSVAWVGDVRCYVRMPGSDASVQFAKAPTNLFAQTNATATDHSALTANNIRATAVTCPATGTLASLSFNFNAAMTGHAKMALYDATGAGGGAGSLLASSVELTNPGAGGVTAFSVTGGPTVTKGTTYWVALWSDASITPNGMGAFSLTSDTLTVTYTTSFPSTMTGFNSSVNPGGLGSNGMNVTPFNVSLVNEAQQDAATSYVFDSTVGHADFYNLAALGVTPASVIAVITRGFVAKSDAGTRTGAVQLKSGGTTVASSAPALSTSFSWLWRVDVVDPATSSPWTAAGVNSAQIGATVIT